MLLINLHTVMQKQYWWKEFQKFIFKYGHRCEGISTGCSSMRPLVICKFCLAFKVIFKLIILRNQSLGAYDVMVDAVVVDAMGIWTRTPASTELIQMPIVSIHHKW